jgi:ABC-type transport system involved in cytochrome c biogenesis permease subunit
MSNSSSKIGRWIAAGLALALLLAVFANVVVDNMPQGEARQIEGYAAWPDETLKIAESIPLQDGGRVKPLSAYAGFTMLGLHGARSMEIEGAPVKLSTMDRLIRKMRGQNEKTVILKPTAWLLDTLFRPQLAVNLPTFRIDNSAVIEAIGLKTRGKRDRYSYADIIPARAKLLKIAQSYDAIRENKRKLNESEALDPVQDQTLALAYNFVKYERLLNYLGIVRYGVTLHGSGQNGAPDKWANISSMMATAPLILQQAAQTQASGEKIESTFKKRLEQILDGVNDSKYELFILPPADAKDRVWQSSGDVIMSVFSETKQDPKFAIKDIELLENVARSLNENEGSFRTSLISLRDNLAKRAEARGEYGHVVSEANFYRQNRILYALVFFIIATATALAMWTLGKGILGRLLYWTTLVSTLAGLVLCVAAITQRSIIMQRPPVGNLYDTITFIAAAVVIFALLIEWMTRLRFALGIAPILGTLLIILSRRYELGDAKDYNDPLIAVLDSNYWLTTHVLTITLGYAAGLLAGFISVIYLLVRGLRLLDDDQQARRFFTRASYGMICLTLFLALVGTVLGGIWANDSWGRFWGWDPKENGALLIVLWTLAILHGRLGGYIREWGLHFTSVFTAAVVAFSWWHVNFLNTGLHNYGFTAEKKYILFVFYGIVAAVIIFGFIAKAMIESRKAPTR